MGFEELVGFDLEKANQWDKSGERTHRDKSLEAVTVGFGWKTKRSPVGGCV